MHTQNYDPVPSWVRSYICIVASSSILILVIAACVGANINIWLSVAVGSFAFRATSFAFAHNNQPQILNDSKKVL